MVQKHVPLKKKEKRKGRGDVCVRVTLSTSCDSVGGVGLVTHYKCQKDLSPKPVHLLLEAAGATDGELVVAQTASTHHKTFTTYLLSLSLSLPIHVSPQTDQHPLSVSSPRVTAWEHLQLACF